MLEQSPIHVGTTVVTADGQSAGKVIALRTQDFIVEGGIFIKYHCSYLFDDIGEATPTHIHLKRDSSDLEQPWNVTEWIDSAGNIHHIRQVGVPFVVMPSSPESQPPFAQ